MSNSTICKTLILAFEAVFMAKCSRESTKTSVQAQYNPIFCLPDAQKMTLLLILHALVFDKLNVSAYPRPFAKALQRSTHGLYQELHL